MAETYKIHDFELPGYITVTDSRCEKVMAICREDKYICVGNAINNCLMIKVKEENEIRENKVLTIAGIHLAAMESGESRRRYQIRNIRQMIEEQERIDKSSNSMVIGDFNANPYDYEIVGHDCFNAVLFKNLICKSEMITWERRKIKRFYNPMLDCISEKEKLYGSYYFHDENRPLYWNCIDQVLVRKALIDYIDNVRIIQKIGEVSLITTHGLINKKYSDHLPLVVDLNIPG